MTSKTVTITCEGGDMQGYLATPETPNGSAIVVLQEIFGVNANIREITDGFAAQGYFALAPDLFWRQEPDVQIEPDDDGAYDRAKKFLAGMDFPKAVSDANAAAQWLLDQDGVSGTVGAVGYCMGGNLAYQLSRAGTVTGIVVFYGTGLHNVLSAADDFAGKILIHVAEADHLCPPEAQAAIVEVGKANPNITVIPYPGAGHAFGREGSEHYNPTAAARAKKETDQFFSTVL